MEHTILWQSNCGKHGLPFLSVKNNSKYNYNYTERAGKDSIAFILINEISDTETLYGLIQEFKPPIDEFLLTAFGGSIDKSIDLIDIVKEEVLEESGFTVTSNRILYLGRRFVSTQMNQFCHLYSVNVTGLQQNEPKPENEIESMAKIKWVLAETIINGIDWKAQTILQQLTQARNESH